MNPVDLFHFLTNVLRSQAEVIAAFLVGVFLTVIAFYTIRRWLFHSETDLAKKDAEIARKDSEIARKEAENVALARKIEAEEQQAQTAKKKYLREKKQLQETIAQLSENSKEHHAELATDAETHKKDLEAAQKLLDLYKRKAVTVVVSYKKQLAAQTDHIKEIDALEGRIWEAPPRPPIPPFRPLEERQAVIIAVTNLKGGVGKTSLTANLAATLWQRGKKVLAVDLDHQASLTNLCLSLERIHDLTLGDRKFVENVLKARDDFARVAWNNLTHLNDDGSCLLAASEDLADVEEHAKAQWLIAPGAFDMRYILRAALHDPLIQDRFDIILLDCPPRWTPASINALACCDFVLVPVLLDRTSAEAVPRLLAWMKSLKNKNVCPDLAILGIIGNRAFRKQQLTKREQGVWEILQGACADRWGAPVYLFSRFLPTSAQFAEAAERREFAAFDESLRPIFEELANEIDERKAHHEGVRTAAVS
jgi:cellulose biosynthesis protein BcsQ